MRDAHISGYGGGRLRNAQPLNRHPLTKRHIRHLGVIFFVFDRNFFLKIVFKTLIDFATQ